MNFKDNVFVSEAGAVVETVIRMSIGFAGTKASNICINLKAPSVKYFYLLFFRGLILMKRLLIFPV